MQKLYLWRHVLLDGTFQTEYHLQLDAEVWLGPMRERIVKLRGPIRPHHQFFRV